MLRASPLVYRFAFAAAAILLGGCTKPADPAANPTPSHSSPLRLLVVDDPAMAKQIARVKGEWKARSGGDLELREMTHAELTTAKSLSADAVIYPSAELGSLVERRLIRPLPQAWTSREEFHEADLFEPGVLAECRWGEQIYAMPFGSHILVIMYRRDLFDRFHLEPPRTWTEYQRLVAALHDRRKELPELQLLTVEPLGGTMLLARAAAYAKHRDYYATLFDKDTMAPQIASPPFVRALEELIAAKDPNWGFSLTGGFGGARRALLEGQCALAVTWPITRAELFSSTPAEAIHANLTAIAFAELPGSTEVYNPKNKSWEPIKQSSSSQAASPVLEAQSRSTESRAELPLSRVPLLSISGRLGSVTLESTSAESAFRLLAWLSGDEWGSQICSASSATTLFRRAQLSKPEQWVEPKLSRGAAKEYADVVSRSLTQPQWLDCPRIPGHAEYMAALDSAARAAAEGKQSPAEALGDAAKRWQEITVRIGLDSQRAAYVRSLGLEP